MNEPRLPKPDRDRRQLGNTDLKRLHREWHHRTERRVGLILDGIMTPYNVGSIARLAAAFRASPVWTTGATVPVSHPGARKTALGTDRYLDIRAVRAPADAVAAAHADGFTVLGVELTVSARPVFERDLPAATCFALGHEDHGLSGACLAACDGIVYVPLVGKVGSLNVATAAGIVLYEARRQEWTTPGPAEE